MGRKKRKVDASEGAIDDEAPTDSITEVAAPPQVAVAVSVPRDPRRVQLVATDAVTENAAAPPSEGEPPVASSGYAMTSHSGQLVPEDTYVSDGSSSEDETEVVVTTSRMGMMRRGLYQSTVLPQANRQWTRQDKDAAAPTGESAAENGGTAEPVNGIANAAADEAAFLAKLDPTQRAAWLLAEKQRREAAAILEARRQENEDNASRDPTLFSKRTAFDIRFDQIDDKPWHRNGTQEHNPQHAEFFNYGLSEDDWLEYAEQQQLVRQELIDASRQKRPPDPNIIPVQIRPKDGSAVTTVAVPKAPAAETKDEGVNGGNPSTVGEPVAAAATNVDVAATTSIGPPSQDTSGSALAAQLAPQQQEAASVPVGEGGAWGAGIPDAVLAKLMEDSGSSTNVDTSSQATPSERNTVKSERDVSYYGNNPSEETSHRDSGGYHHAPPHAHGDDYHSRGGGHWKQHDPYSGEGGGWSSDAYYSQSIPPPPPPPPQGNPGYYGSHRGRGDGYGFRGGRGGRGGYHDGGGSGDYYPESSNTGWKRPRDGMDPRRRR